MIGLFLTILLIIIVFFGWSKYREVQFFSECDIMFQDHTREIWTKERIHHD